MRPWLLLCGLALGGCDEPDPLNRMVNQKKQRAYSETPVFADRRAMRVPPVGTVPRERPLGLERQMPQMTVELLKVGQHRYGIVCATCHGITGEADTLVSSNFVLRPPPSLHEERLREKPDRYFYDAIAKGYGLMPSFPDIPLEERWPVVAYVRALQLSQRAPLLAAPPEVREQLLAMPPKVAQGGN